MKHTWLAAFLLLKIALPLEPVGTCHFGPNCQGPIIRQGVTPEACAHAGGHSIHISGTCKSF
jgi:hypothetical protein